MEYSAEAGNSKSPHEKYICCPIMEPKFLGTFLEHETHKCKDMSASFILKG